MLRNRYISAAFLLLLMLAVTGLVKPSLAAADENGRFDINVEAGLKGKAQAEKGFPVTVSIKNNGRDFTGDLVVTIPSDEGAVGNIVIPVQLAAGSEKSITFPVSGMRRGFFLHGPGKGMQQFHLYEGGWENGEEIEIDPNLTINPAFLPPFRVVIGILADNHDALNYFKLPTVGKSQPTVIPLEGTELPDSAVALEVLDVLVINDYAVAQLPEDVQQAIREWVYAGGRLIVGSTPGMMQHFGKLADILPFSVTGQTTVHALPELKKAGGAALHLKNFEVLTGKVNEGAKVVYQHGRLPVVIRAEAGKGTVSQYAFDLAHPSFSQWKGIEQWWQSNLKDASLSIHEKMVYDSNRQLSRISSLFQSLASLPFTGILLLLIGYVFIIIPLLYFLLKRFDKREWSWGVIPALSVIFSIGLFIYGAHDRLGAIKTNAVSIVTLSKNGMGTGISSISMLSQNAGDYTINVEGSRVFPAGQNDPFRDESLSHIPLVKHTSGQTKVTFQNVEFWSPRTLFVHLPAKDYGGFETDFKYKDGKIEGEIKNRSSYNFEKVMLLGGTGQLSIGGLEARETKSVSLKATAGMLFQAPRPRQIMKLNVVHVSPNTRQDKEKRKKRELMRAALQSGSFDVQSPVLVAFTQSSLYSAHVNGEATKQTSLGLFVQPVTIQLPENGSVSFSTDIHMPELSAISGNIQFNPIFRGESVFMASVGTYELKYHLPKVLAGYSYNLKSITVQLRNRNQNSEFQIYNTETGRFEDLADGFVFEFKKKPKIYVDRGAIRIRVEKISGDPQVRIPKVTIEGVTQDD
ncbi:MAG TPA: hypothetical protein VFJ73_00280 [Bacillales bacterium]|nr:hypothetical protein [Bacillales bacterium]